TIVKVSGGLGYVLTAAHCCNSITPSLLVMSDDYFVALPFVGRLAPLPPVSPVTSGSVYFDSAYDGTVHDFCMLTFSAPAGTPSIPIPSGADGLSLGTQLEHVGYGDTDSSTSNTGRRTGTAPLDQTLSASRLIASEGGSSHLPGICLGDSGGPVLVPAGA